MGSKQQYRIDTTLDRGSVQSCLSFFIFRIYVRTLCEEHFDPFNIPIGRGLV